MLVVFAILFLFLFCFFMFLEKELFFSSKTQVAWDESERSDGVFVTPFLILSHIILGEVKSKTTMEATRLPNCFPGL